MYFLGILIGLLFSFQNKQYVCYNCVKRVPYSSSKVILLFYGPLYRVVRVAAGELGYHLFKESCLWRGLLAKAAGIRTRINAGLEVWAGAS